MITEVAETVNKLEAARRQLEESVDLFFHDRDPIAIHTLTAAAHTILRDLNWQRMEQTGESPNLSALNVTIKDLPFALSTLDTRESVAWKEFAVEMNAAENFFKHADRDPGDVFLLRPEYTELLLWDACRMYERLSRERRPRLTAFQLWQCLSHPQVLADDPRAAEFARLAHDLERHPERRPSKLEVYAICVGLKS